MYVISSNTIIDFYNYGFFRMKIFLDDTRIPSDCLNYMWSRSKKLTPIYMEKWEIVRNYENFVIIITENYTKIK